MPDFFGAYPFTIVGFQISFYRNHQKEQYGNGRNSKRHKPNKAGSPAEVAWKIKPRHQPQVTNNFASDTENHQRTERISRNW